VPGLGVQGFQAPVVEDEQVDGAEGLDPARGAAVAVGQGEVVEQLGRADNSPWQTPIHLVRTSPAIKWGVING
jgi:hypothetical protein